MFHLFVATPENVVFDENITSLIAPGTAGYFEILTNHASIMSSLTSGRLTIVDKDKKRWVYAVSGGIFEFTNNRGTLLADTLELSTEIDLPRAERAVQKAEKIIAEHEEGADLYRAKKALKRARNRVKLAKEAETQNR